MEEQILQERDVVRFEEGLAIVRFAGEVDFDEGSWVGLELSNANGDCDGSRQGKQYFECEAKHGVFVQSKNIVKKIHAEEILKKFVNAQAKHKAELAKLKERMMKLKKENDRLREAYPRLLEEIIFEVVDEKAILEMGCDKESMLAAWAEYVGQDAEGAKDMSERDIKQNVAMCCFKICDKSGDGFVDIEEASNMYKTIMNDEMYAALKNFDKDALKISFKDWMDIFSNDLQINMRGETAVDVIFETVDETIILEMGITREQLGALWKNIVDRDADETRVMPKNAMLRSVADCCFKAADKSGDGQIQLAEAKKLYQAIMDEDMPSYAKDDAAAELLEDADENNDGVLSFVEWLNYFSFAADVDMEREIQGEKLFKELCLLVDRNHDKEVDLEEFAEVYPLATQTFFQQLDLNENHLLEIQEFKQMWLLADGAFDIEEMQQAIKNLNDAMFTEQFNRLMTLVDANHDGRISMPEFEKIFPLVTAQFYNVLDLDHDGSLDKVEFREVFILADGSLDHQRIKEMVDLFRTPYEKEIDRLFEALDVDVVDGKLSVDEFNGAYPNMNVDSIQSLLKFIDGDCDGLLNKKEIMKFLPSMNQVKDVMKNVDARDTIVKIVYENISKDYLDTVGASAKDIMEAWRSVTAVATPEAARKLSKYQLTRICASVLFDLNDKSRDASVDCAVGKFMYKQLMGKDYASWENKDDYEKMSYDQWMMGFTIDNVLPEQEAIAEGNDLIFAILDSECTDGKISFEEMKRAYPNMQETVWEIMIFMVDKNQNFQLEKEEFKKHYSSAYSIGELLGQLEAQNEIADSVIYRIIDESAILQMGAKRRDIIQLWTQEFGLSVAQARSLSKTDLKFKIAKLCFMLADKSGDGYVDKTEAKALYKYISDSDIPSWEADDNAEELINDADENDDGKISLSEFIKYFQIDLKLKDHEVKRFLRKQKKKKESEAVPDKKANEEEEEVEAKEDVKIEAEKQS